MSANHTEIAPAQYGVFTPCSCSSKTWETARARSEKITEVHAEQRIVFKVCTVVAKLRARILSGKDKEAIAAEPKAAFKLPDTQAVKIVRRITGRARFFQRVGELMTAN
jgi:hypothetical protein